MNFSIDAFRMYLDNNPPNYEHDDIHSLLELFGSYYIMCNPIENENIKGRFQSLERIMKSLSRKREHRLLHTITEVCEEYGRAAFTEGLRAGAQLMMELLDLK